MAYDGRVLRRAIARFEEDRQERETRFQERRETIFRRQPRLRQIDAEGCMGVFSDGLERVSGADKV